MAKTDNYIPYILPIGIIAAVFIGGKKILEAIGVIDDGSEQTKQQAQLYGSAFTPSYYKQKPGALLLTNAAADAYARVIYEAKGGIFNDNESAVYGIFQNLKTKTQVSYLADRFQSLFGKSMVAYLQDFLSDSEFLTLVSIVNSLPDVKP